MFLLSTRGVPIMMLPRLVLLHYGCYSHFFLLYTLQSTPRLPEYIVSDCQFTLKYFLQSSIGKPFIYWCTCTSDQREVLKLFLFPDRYDYQLKENIQVGGDTVWTIWRVWENLIFSYSTKSVKRRALSAGALSCRSQRLMPVFRQRLVDFFFQFAQNIVFVE